MNSETYKVLMKNTTEYYMTDYSLQHIIKDLTDGEIATYKENNKNGSILIATSESKNERVNKCMDNNLDTFYIIEKMFINKSYRYAIYYNCNNFNINNVDSYISLEDFKSGKINNIKDFTQPIFVENDEYIAIKFLKTINPFINKLDETKDVIYNTLWIYHKKLKILEHRFDMLGFKSDDNFYETTFKPQLSRICKDFNCDISEFRTSSTITHIVENKKDEVQEIAQYMGLKQNSLAKLKVGETLIMPFIGDLEILMEQNRGLFDKSDDTKQIYKLLRKYVVDIKKNARYKSRLLQWIKEKKFSPCVNILFSYRDKNYDLFNFQEPKKNNMEMMNYVIRYIWKVKGNLENSTD
ncbi:hypothetical protein HAHI6034_05835 [Hathewaya histolytica]|uniref:Uncharacterized protein n=1 Tax=Hathewaya histolytica TaxID=1498 RepID=A0A4U9REN6_HATHI|nr:hypothetical protein [Hathewaya histolytica]VTQ89656.1 Uncharacterised protein [Hathewaya histolytica]